MKKYRVYMLDGNTPASPEALATVACSPKKKILIRDIIYNNKIELFALIGFIVVVIIDPSILIYAIPSFFVSFLFGILVSRL